MVVGYWLPLLATGLAIIGVLAAFTRWIWPHIRKIFRDIRATRDAIIGRDAVIDSITGETLSPKLPSMGQRLSIIETSQNVNVGRVKKIAAKVEKLETAVAGLAISDRERRILLDTVLAAINIDDDHPTGVIKP